MTKALTARGSQQFSACAPPGLAPLKMVVDAASLEVGWIRGVGPRQESRNACTDTGSRLAGACQDTPTSSRDAAKKFKARCHFALRQLRREAPELAAKCKIDMGGEVMGDKVEKVRDSSHGVDSPCVRVTSGDVKQMVVPTIQSISALQVTTGRALRRRPTIADWTTSSTALKDVRLT
jgi:hypothetical protein